MNRHDPQAAKTSPEEEAAAKRLAEDKEAFSRFIDNRWQRRHGGATMNPFSETKTTWRRR